MSKLSAYRFAKQCFTEWLATMGNKCAIPVLCLSLGLEENTGELAIHVAKGNDRETIRGMLLAALKELDNVKLPD